MMRDLSLHVLDIVQNSIRAEATQISITLTETCDTLVLSIRDNGCGMSEELLTRVCDPFSTTRTTRKVGLGIPFLKMACELTGGSFLINSRSRDVSENHGTELSATFRIHHLDCLPLGDMIATLCTLVQGADASVDYFYTHTMPARTVTLSTSEMREVLGADVPLSSPEVLEWLRAYLCEQYGDYDFSSWQ